MAFVEKKLPADAPVIDKALNWVDSRFPLTKLWNDQWGQYYAPKNFNFWYTLHSYPHAAAAVWQIISESDNPTKLVEKLKGMK